MSTYHGRVQINGALTRGYLNIRSRQSRNSAPIAEVDDGTELDVTLTSDNQWFKTTYNGKTGYLQLENFAITEGYPLYRVNVNSGTLNIRSEPKIADDNVIFTAAKDRGLYVLETREGWCLVSCNIGTGWASNSYLVQDSTAQPFDYPTVNEFIERLESFCNCGWSYALGYSSTQKTIDCANYPYVARYSLGAHSTNDEYASISDDEKGPIRDLSELKVGMELFQRDSEASIKHMGVYAGLVNFDGDVLPAVYQSRSVSSGARKAKYKERTGPNLTEMNEKWNYWGWSKYVQH